MEELKQKVQRILADNGLTINGWKKHYNNLSDKPAVEDKASKIARVLNAGKVVEIADLYAGGSSWQEPVDVDFDGTVSYDLDADNIDHFLEHYNL